MANMEEMRFYLIVSIGGESYAIDANLIREIMEVPPLTFIPRMPVELLGLAYSRGSALPVIDLKMKLIGKKSELSPDSVVIKIILENGKTIGLLCDSVKKVVEISINSIDPPPPFGFIFNPQVLKGVFEHLNRFVNILDISRLFTLTTNEDIPEPYAEKEDYHENINDGEQYGSACLS